MNVTAILVEMAHHALTESTSIRASVCPDSPGFIARRTSMNALQNPVLTVECALILSMASNANAREDIMMLDA